MSFTNGLPQLAVLAKILCLLMVVMCGAVPAKVRSVSLYSTCSSGNITVEDRVVRSTGRSEMNAPYQKLSTQSDDFSGKLYIFAEKSQRYICFNKRWKLVGMPKKRKGPMCQFYEEIYGSYLRYKSVVDGTHFVGFNRRGLPLKDGHGRNECFNFVKFNPLFNIPHHNSILSASAMVEQSRKPTDTRTPKKYRAADNIPGSHHHRHNRGKVLEGAPGVRRRSGSRLQKALGN